MAKTLVALATGHTALNYPNYKVGSTANSDSRFYGVKREMTIQIVCDREGMTNTKKRILGMDIIALEVDDRLVFDESKKMLTPVTIINTPIKSNLQWISNKTTQTLSLVNSNHTQQISMKNASYQVKLCHIKRIINNEKITGTIKKC